MQRPFAAIPIVMIGAWLVALSLAGLLTHYDPLSQAIGARLLSPSRLHLFGTDQLGRDVFSRVLYGGRISVPAAIAVVLLAMTVGSVIGLVAGYMQGWLDEVLMRITDVFLAFPVIILAMAISAALGPGIENGILSLALVSWPPYARMTRSIVLELKHREFVTASRAMGRPTREILFRVLLPNALSTLLVIAAVDVGRAIVNFAVLSFLGLGARPPAPEWGAMVANGSQVMQYWWVSTFPGLAILSLVLAFNLLGDIVRDATDPYLQART